jgi:hypothetical protein
MSRLTTWALPDQPHSEEAPDSAGGAASSGLPPIVAATEGLLTDERPVWVPLCTPGLAVCAYAFHPPGYPEREPHAAISPHGPTLTDLVFAYTRAGVRLRSYDRQRPHDRGFRIARWLKATGDFVLKNEPVAVVDGSRARENAVLRGLDLHDPVIYAPESGRLVWQHPSADPHHIFGLIQSTDGLIDANMDHPIRSDLFPWVDAIIARLLQRTVTWRRKIRLYDKAGLDYLERLGLQGRNNVLEMNRRNLFYACHRLWWRTPPLQQRAPGWGKATDHDKEQLRKVYVGPASAQYDHAWTTVVGDLQRECCNLEQMGLAFALTS